MHNPTFVCTLSAGCARTSASPCPSSERELHCFIAEASLRSLRLVNTCVPGQVYTAEEKAALAMYNFEENKRKEQKILADMQSLVTRTLGDDAGEGGDDAAQA